MNAIEKLREVTDTIGTSKNGLQIVDAWALAGRLLTRFPVDAAESKRVLAAKDHPGLDALVRGLENPAQKVQAGPGVSEGDMTAALKAFRKKLKLTKLDQESKLGGRYTSGGKQSNINAIVPPTDFPPEVWRALEETGKLRRVGSGMYEET
jgi:hypothetical protein